MGNADADLVQRWRAGDATALLVALGARAGPIPDSPRPRRPRADLVRRRSCAHRAGPGYRENGHFSTWLFQIALNAARDAGRRARPVGRSRRGTARPRPSAETRCARREVGERVVRAVAELPAPLREVIALRHDAGMNFEEIARQLGVPASTLKSRFAAALRRLRESLRDLDDQEDEP